MRRSLKILGFGLAALLVGLLLIVVAPGFLAPAVQPLRMLLVDAGLAAVSRELKGRVAVGALEGSLLSHPVIRDLRIIDSQNESILHVDTLGLAYDPWSLFHGALQVDLLEITDLHLKLLEQPGGALNLVEVFATGASPEETDEGGGFALPVNLRQASLRGGRIDLALGALPGVERVDDLSLSLGGVLGAEGLQLRVQQATANAQPANVTVETLETEIVYSDERLEIGRFLLETAASRITARGAVPNRARPGDVGLELQPFEVGDLGRLLARQDLRGEIRGEVRATGTLADLGLNGRLATSQGSVALEGIFDVTGSKPRYRGSADVIGLNLISVIAREALASDLNARLRFDGLGLSPTDMHAEVDLDLSASRLGEVLIEPSRIDLAVDSQRFEVREFDLKTSVLDAAVAGHLDLAGESRLTYRVFADLVDLRELLGVEDLRGDLRMVGDASGTWPDLIAEGDLEARNLVYAGSGLERLDAAFRASDLAGGPEVDATLSARDAQIGNSGIQAVDVEAALSRSGDTSSAQFELALSQSPELGGRVLGKFVLGEEGFALKVDEFQARVGDRVWKNVTPLNLTSAAGLLDLEPFRLEHGEEALEFSGGFGGSAFRDVRVQATELDLSAIRDTLTLSAPIGGRLNLNLSLDGSLEKPILQSVLALDDAEGGVLPFERADLSLDYQDARLEGEAGVNQSGKKTLGLALDVPIDLALTALSLDERLQPGTLSVDLDFDELDVGELAHALQGESQVAGSLSGNLNLDGTYVRLGVESELDLGELSFAGVVQEIRGALRTTAQISSADSLDALRETLRDGHPSVSVSDLLLESSAISARLSGDGPGASMELGELRIAGSGAWRDEGLAAELGEARVRVAVEGFPETSLSLMATLSPEYARLERLGIETEGSSIRAQGAYALSGGGLDFTLAIPNLELREFVADLPANLPTEVSGEVLASGTVDTPKLVARLRYANADIDADLDAALAEQPPRYGANVEVLDLDLSQFTATLVGRLSTQLRLQGEGFAESERVAELHVQTDSEDLSVLPGLRGLVEARVRGATLELSKLDIGSPALALEAEGSLSPAGVDAIGYRLKFLDLSSLSPTVGAPVAAGGVLNGTLSGSYQALQTRNRLELQSWQYGDWMGGQLTAQLDASGFPTSPAASGKIELTELVGPGVTGTSVTLETRYANERAEFSLAANSGPFENSRFAGEGDFSGGVDARVDVLRLQRGEWIWENAGPLRAGLNEGGDLTIENLDLRNGSQSISVDGTLRSDGRLSGSARIQSLQLQSALGAFTEPATPLFGAVSADLEASGTLERPQITGSFETSELRWQEAELGRLDADVTARERVVDASARWLYEQREVLTADGRWSPDRPDALDVRVRADGFDLGRLQPLSNEVLASSGRLDLDLAVTGTLEQPRATGSLDVSDGELQLAMLGERFRDLQSEIVFSGQRVDIRRLELVSQSGNARLSGWFEADDLSSFRTDLALVSDNFTAINTPGISADITSEITVRGSHQDLDVRGTIAVPRARVRYEALPASGAANVEPWELTIEGVYGAGKEAALADMETEVPGTRRAAPSLDFLRASLALDIPRNAWVQGKGTSVELTGDLKVRKRLRETFILSGTIDTRRGFASVMGKRFEIENGTITFSGSKEINPFLDILAVHQTRGYTIYVAITGESKKPKLDFYSIPELDQADIISLLLFGRTQDKLSSSEQNGFAGNVAGSVAAGVLEQSVGAGLGLDTIAIDLGDETSGGSVGVGRYLSNDLYLSYERSFRDPQRANRGGNTVGLEFSLTPRIKLRGTGSDFGETAVDIFWQVDY